MECTFLSSFCSSSVSMASLFSPAALPPSPLSRFFFFLSPFRRNLSTLPFFFFFLFLRCPPTLIYPFYLPPSFRRRFSSSSPVAHPGVTRFSVAGGKRGGSRLSQEVNRRRAARKNALVMVTSRLRFRIDELFFFFAETYLSVTPGDGAQTCDRCRERSRRHSTH